MTRCYFHLKNSSRYVVKVVGTRGSDWGDIVNDTHQPREQNFTVVQSMGCPRAGTETDHWGEVPRTIYPSADTDEHHYRLALPDGAPS